MTFYLNQKTLRGFENILTADQIIKAYYFRWRIEIIFKAWKSMLALKQLNFHSEHMLHISIFLKLLLCAFTHGTAFNLELTCRNQNQHVSILRTARVITDSLPLLIAYFFIISPEDLFKFRLQKHAFYERRKDRKNFCERLYISDGRLFSH